METILLALISAVASIVGSYFANRKSVALMEYRLKEVEKNIAVLKDDKTEINAIRTELEVLSERIKVANNRIRDLENNGSR